MNRILKLSCIVLILLTILSPINAYCDELDDMLIQQYDQYDFSTIDDFFNRYNDNSFSGIIQSILDGSFDLDESFWNNLVSIILPSLKKAFENLPLLFILILVLGILNNISNNSRFYASICTASNAIICIILLYSFVIIYRQVTDAFKSLNEALNALMPVLTVALVASGATSTAGTINPESAILAQTISNILTNIIFPLIIIIAVFLVLDSVFINGKYSKIIAFGKSTATWVIGTTFTVYAAIISIKGMVATSYDGISLRTLRYALSNSVPLIGSLVGDGVNMALTCCTVVKSAIGVAAFILIILTIASPIATLIIYMLALKLLAACALPLTAASTVNLISSMADLVKILLSALIGMTIILLIIIGFTVGAASAI